MNKDFLSEIRGNKEEFRRYFYECGAEDEPYDRDILSIIFSDKEFYSVIKEEGREDDIFMNIGYSDINSYIIEIIRGGNRDALDFAIDNSEEIGFDIDHIERNRGWLEISMFFNQPEILQVLIDSGITVSNRISNSICSWIKNNSLFIKNQMHQKYHDKDWKRSFMDIVGIISNIDNKILRDTAKKIISDEIKELDVELSKSITSLGAERISEKILRLDKNTIINIMDLLEYSLRER